MPFRIEISPLPSQSDARGHSTEEKIKDYIEFPIKSVRTRDVYTIDADISESDAERVASEINNPVIQSYRINQAGATCTWMITTGFLPGVTDNVARSAASAISDMLGRKLTKTEAVYSHTEYLLDAPELSRDDVMTIATTLLANPLIHSINIYDSAQCASGDIPQNTPRIESEEEAMRNVLPTVSVPSPLMLSSKPWPRHGPSTVPTKFSQPMSPIPILRQV